MEVTVNMTAEEFLEFVAWGKDRDYYKSRLDKELNKLEILAKKTCWAIDADPKKPGKVKIIDQEHAAELLEMAKGLPGIKRKATCARCCQHGAGGNIDDGKPSDIPILYQVPGRNTSRKNQRGHGPV